MIRCIQCHRVELSTRWHGMHRMKTMSGAPNSGPCSPKQMLPVRPVAIARQRLNGEGREEREERALAQPPPPARRTAEEETTRPPQKETPSKSLSAGGASPSCPPRLWPFGCAASAVLICAMLNGMRLCSVSQYTPELSDVSLFKT